MSIAPSYTFQRQSNLLSSRNQITELATPAQRNQSLKLKLTVENACCRNGVYTTATCNNSDKATAPQSHLLDHRSANALRSSERALKTVNIEKKTIVVKAIVCA